MTQRDRLDYDVVIVGAGPAGLAAAIRLKQCNADINVCVLEKGAEAGAHLMSGCAFDPKALNALLPDWKDRNPPAHTPITTDTFQLLTKRHAVNLPTPPSLHNEGNYIISLSDLGRFLAREAEGLGVNIFPGFPAVDTIVEDGKVCGVITGDMGVDKKGEKKAQFQPGVEVRGTYTLLAEGCRGSLSERIMDRFDLRAKADPQSYGIGIKEIWEVLPQKHQAGTVVHTIGWPLDTKTYGGSFIYHMNDNKVAIGYIVGLDYRNPHLDPYQEFQRFKTHPAIRPLLEGGKRIMYGARAINEGGLQSQPGLTFPGGALIGCSAGFLNVARIKGVHLAMHSGMLAAESIAKNWQEKPSVLVSYPEAFKASWAYQELHAARNIRPGFHAGLWQGLVHAALDAYVFRGRAPWTWHTHIPDHARLIPADKARRIDYPAPDGVITFDRMSSVFLSSTNHAEDQPCHLTLHDTSVPVVHNLPYYNAPEQRYCPAGVYEIVREAAGEPRLQINAQNCVHCKTCDIKDPTQNIRWIPPEGGGGPNYSGM